MKGKVLTIAGSDSGGGAGIQADIKTINSLDCYASSAITALTAQNTLGVHGIFDISPEFISKQIEAVLSDIGADIIKIGMVGNINNIVEVANTLKKHPQIPIVLDTVMIAKGGQSLLTDGAVDELINLLIKNAFLVTPNIPEAEILSKIKIENIEDMHISAKKIMELGANNVLLKGGHMQGDIVYDLLYCEDGSSHVFEHRKINSKNTHGTGCTLSSAIAAYLAKNESLKIAILKARNYVFNAIENAPDGIGTGHGPLLHKLI